MKKLSTLIFLALLPLMASAYDAEVDGIYYNLIKKARLAWVTSGDVQYTGNVDIPETFTYDGQIYNVTSVASEAFSGCTGLTSVTIPNSVTNIGTAAFQGCSNLTTVFIGSGVETIEDAFVNCLELTDVYCSAINVPTTNSNAFKGSYVGYATLYVPGASMTAYKAAAPWSGFGNIKEYNIPINEINFPDENFRNWILNQDYGSDGVLTEDEIAGVTTINVSYYNTFKSINNLEGIQFFSALVELNCHGNKLTSLDVTKNTALKSLTCSYNKLTSLDVSGCTALTALWCDKNQLTSLDVSKNTALDTLYCHDNQLTSLDVSKNTALTLLFCSSNQLTALNVSGCTALTLLTCKNNLFTSLEVSGCTALTSLDCGNNNQLTSLNISGCTALTSLICKYSKLTSLDISGCPMLTSLECWGNQLTSLNVSVCTALTSLICKDNQLSSLNVSGCTALTSLDCYKNRLTSLDLSKNTALTSLNSSNNKLTTLNVTKNTALTSLNCSDNKLTALDLSKNTKLMNLYCDGNQFTALDLSGCTVLSWLECYSNQIKDAAMDAFIESLPPKSYFTTMRIIYDVNEGNVMTTTQVAAAKAKGWTPYYLSPSGSWREYAGSEPTAVKTIDANAADRLPDGKYIKNGKLVIKKGGKEYNAAGVTR